MSNVREHIDPDLWEISHLYRVLVFQKKKKNTDRIDYIQYYNKYTLFQHFSNEIKDIGQTIHNSREGQRDKSVFPFNLL